MSVSEKEPYLQRLHRVASEIDQFIAAHSGGAITPVANFTYAPNGADSLAIGDITVWSSEECGHEDLTLDFCLQEYRDQLRDLMTIFEDGSLPERPDPPEEDESPKAIEDDASKA